jgi:hypothetical protein
MATNNNSTLQQTSSADESQKNDEKKGLLAFFKEHMTRLVQFPCFIPSFLKGIVIGSGLGIVRKFVFKSMFCILTWIFIIEK